jgi:hypothetical protein
MRTISPGTWKLLVTMISQVRASSSLLEVSARASEAKVNAGPPTPKKRHRPGHIIAEFDLFYSNLIND